MTDINRLRKDKYLFRGICTISHEIASDASGPFSRLRLRCESRENFGAMDLAVFRPPLDDAAVELTICAYCRSHESAIMRFVASVQAPEETRVSDAEAN